MDTNDIDDTAPGKPRSRETENMKPGSPPRPATEPDGAENSTQTTKTLTDPATGEPLEDVSDNPQVPH